MEAKSKSLLDVLPNQPSQTSASDPFAHIERIKQQRREFFQKSRGNLSAPRIPTAPPSSGTQGGGIRDFTGRQGQIDGSLESFAPYMDGIDLGRDLNSLRAQNQSTGQQVIRTLLKYPAAVALSLAEGVGSLGDLPALVHTFQPGAGDDYTNWLNGWAREQREKLNEGLPVYRENPDQVFDLSDPAFYLEFGSSIAESLPSFFVLGLGSSAAFGKAASLLAKAADAGANANRALRGASALSTAASLAFVEGAMDGASVYEATKQDAILRGVEHAMAEKAAGVAAATATRSNTFLNTAVNLPTAFMMLRNVRTEGALKAAGLSKKSGESNPDWIKRLTQDPKTKSMMGETLSVASKEAPLESLEEVVNTISQAEGMFVGQQLTGDTSDKRTYMERVVDTILSPEAALAAIGGAIGGIGQSVGIQLASMRILKEDGKKGWQFKSSGERALKQEAAGAMRTELLSLLNKHEESRKKMEEYAGDDTKRGEYERAKNDIFYDVLHERITKGIEQQMVSVFEDILNMPEETAANTGWDTNPESDEYYKTLARNQINKINTLAKRWTDIQDTYAFDDDERLSRLPRYIFKLEAEKEKASQNQKYIQELLDVIETKRKEVNNENDVDPLLDDVLDLQNEQDNLIASIAQLDEKKAEIDEAIKNDKVFELFNTRDPESLIRANAAARTDLNSNLAKVSESLKSATDSLTDKHGSEDKAADVLSNHLLTNAPLKIEAKILSDAKAANTAALAEINRRLSDVTGGKGRRSYSKAFLKQVQEDAEKITEQLLEQAKAAETPEEREAVRKEAVGDETVEDELQKQEARLATKETMILDEALKRDDEIENASTSLADQTLSPVDAEREEELMQTLRNQPTIEAAEEFALDFIKLLHQTTPEFDKRVDDYIEARRKEELGASTSSVKTAAEVYDTIDDTHPEEPSQNSAKTSDTVEQYGEVDATSEGFKIVNAAYSIAYKSRDHFEIDLGDSIIKGDASDSLIDNVIGKIHSHKHLQTGDTVVISLDEEFKDDKGDGAKEYIERGEWRNAPMKIEYKGETIGWVRTHKWISARNPGGFAKNVAEESEGLSDNVDVQAQEILKLRRTVLKSEKPVKMEITNHGIGMISLAKTRIPMAGNIGEDVKFVVYRDDKYVQGFKEPITVPHVIFHKPQNGSVAMLLGTPSTNEEGKRIFVPTPLWIPNLAETQDYKPKNVFNIIAAFHGQEGEEAQKQIQKESGDSNMLGLVNYLSSFLYDAPFSTDDLVKDPKQNISKVFFQLRDTTGHVRLAAHQGRNAKKIIYTTSTQKIEGENSVYMFEKDTNGNYIHEAAILDILSRLPMNIRSSRMNSTRPVRHYSKGPNGWTHIKVPHKQMLRENIKTPVRGHDVEVDGKTEKVYFEQGVVEFGPPSAEEKPARVEPDAIQEEPLPEATPEELAQLEKYFPEKEDLEGVNDLFDEVDPDDGELFDYPFTTLDQPLSDVKITCKL